MLVSCIENITILPSIVACLYHRVAVQVDYYLAEKYRRTAMTKPIIIQMVSEHSKTINQVLWAVALF